MCSLSVCFVSRSGYSPAAYFSHVNSTDRPEPDISLVNILDQFITTTLNKVDKLSV